jgi:hypothetical protein
MRGTVISLHSLGATVRLEDGNLGSVPAADLERHRPAYSRALALKLPLAFECERRGRHAVLRLADEVGGRFPSTLRRNDDFEAQLNRYLKETEEWAPPDQLPPAERHFIRKKKRAAFFEARGKGT